MTKRKLRKTKKSLGAESRGHSTGLGSVQQCPLSCGVRCPYLLTDEGRRLPIPEAVQDIFNISHQWL